MPLLRSIWSVGKWGFAVLVICGVIGGLGADLDGVAKDPAGKEFIGFASKFVSSILYVIRSYPIGFLIAWIVVASVHWLFTHDHVQSMRNEYDEARRRAREKRGRTGKANQTNRADRRRRKK